MAEFFEFPCRIGRVFLQKFHSSLRPTRRQLTLNLRVDCTRRQELTRIFKNSIQLVETSELFNLSPSCWLVSISILCRVLVSSKLFHLSRRLIHSRLDSISDLLSRQLRATRIKIETFKRSRFPLSLSSDANRN